MSASSVLKMERACFSEILVPTYKSKWRFNLEDRHRTKWMFQILAYLPAQKLVQNELRRWLRDKLEITGEEICHGLFKDSL
jgi:hypothetical protein